MISDDRKQQSTDQRHDLVCRCYFEDESLWGPACQHFHDDDRGICMDCGHEAACHEHP